MKRYSLSSDVAASEEIILHIDPDTAAEEYPDWSQEDIDAANQAYAEFSTPDSVIEVTIDQDEQDGNGGPKFAVWGVRGNTSTLLDEGYGFAISEEHLERLAFQVYEEHEDGTFESLEDAKRCVEMCLERARLTPKKAETAYIDICPLMEDDSLGDPIEVYKYL